MLEAEQHDQTLVGAPFTIISCFQRSKNPGSSDDLKQKGSADKVTTTRTLLRMALASGADSATLNIVFLRTSRALVPKLPTPLASKSCCSWARTVCRPKVRRLALEGTSCPSDTVEMSAQRDSVKLSLDEQGSRRLLGDCLNVSGTLKRWCGPKSCHMVPQP